MRARSVLRRPRALGPRPGDRAGVLRRRRRAAPSTSAPARPEPARPRRRSARSRGPLVRDDAHRTVEALLFLAREPLSARRLAQLAELEDGTAARAAVRALNRLYDREGRAFTVEAVAGGYRLLTRGRFAPWLRRLDLMPTPVRLSAPMLETLAVIAWRQPVPRGEIEAIRGVSCGEIVRQLLERDLVRLVGRSDELGRPYLYGTTRRFLMLFGLRGLSDLPTPGRSPAASLRPDAPTAPEPRN